MDIALDQAAIGAIFDLPNNDGAFPEDLRAYLGSLGARRPSIVFAFPPKAAGTFLRSAAIKATGGELLRVGYAQGARDTQPYMPTFIAYYMGGFCAGPLVTHIHMQAFPANISFLEAFGIRPVIMIRSVADMLASYWDMLEGNEKSLTEGLNCTIPKDFRTLSAGRKQDFLIDAIAPWYVGYYATWLEYAERERDRVCLLDYSDFIEKPASTLETVLDHVGIPRSNAECQFAIDAVWGERYDHRFNHGLEGRAHEYFSIRHFERIGNMLSFYPSTISRRANLIGL
jgi:hypothetical protein